MNRKLIFLAVASISAGTGFARAAEDREHVIVEKVNIAASEAGQFQADAWKRWAEDYSAQMRTSMGAMFGSRLGARNVKGAPYSAQVITETNQPLADGNVISRKTNGAVYRDSEGRTRQESGGDGREPTVYIQDPVAGKSVVLSPGSKKAVVTLLPKAMASGPPSTEKHAAHVRNSQVYNVDDTSIRIEDGKVFLNGKEVPDGNVQFRTNSGKELRIENGNATLDGRPLRGSVRVITNPRTEVRSFETSDADGNVRREEIRVQVVHAGDSLPVPPTPPTPPTPPAPLAGPSSLAHPVPPMPPLPPMPGIQTMRFESTAKLGKGVTTQLGTKDFEGVKADGKVTTWTIPAGEIGNRAPINVTSESWYSPELQVTVFSRYNDPRTGESVYRLAGIRRGEPGASLFAVPEEYALKDKTRN